MVHRYNDCIVELVIRKEVMEQIYQSSIVIEKEVADPKSSLAPVQSASAQAFASVKDDELFIRKNLEENPRLGVELLYKRYYQPMCTHAVKFVGCLLYTSPSPRD